jgi:cytidine deaminase
MKSEPFFDNLEELDSESKYLVHKAKEATLHAYAPYSKFLVGTALLLEDGTLVTGSNQENASYPLSMCAERVALYAAASQFPGKVIKKIAIVAHKKSHKELSIATSCGGCRQVMMEYEIRQKSPIEVVMLCEKNRWIIFPSVGALLPYHFNSAHLHD